MEKWAGQVVLLTGASAGIGAATVEKLVDRGLKVVGIARGKEQLEELRRKLCSKKGKFYPFEGDLCKEEDILKAFQWTKENVGPVSILINNAGIVRPANLSESNTEMWRELLNLNVLAYCITTREAIKQMKDNNIDGHIINLNSIGGHTVLDLPKHNLYPASKYAVTALTETLRRELAGQDSKIRVTSLSPGLVMTENVKTYLEQMSLSEEAIKSMKSVQTSDVAEAILYILSTPKHVNISQLTIQAVGAVV